MPACPKPVKGKTNKQKISKLKIKLSTLVKNYIKIRDNYTCQKCGAKVEGSNCHASHVKPVSSGNVLAFEPLNMKVLCYHCHINWWHKNPTESGEWFRQKFPERMEYLDKHQHNEVHWKEYDYLEMIDKYKALLV